MAEFVMPVQASPRNALYWMLGFAALSGVTTAFPSRHLGALMCSASASLALSFSLFLWYCRDGNLRNFRRTWWWNFGIVTNFFFLVFPFYLWRTRARGERWQAIGKAMLCGLMLLAAMGTGAALGSFLVA